LSYGEALKLKGELFQAVRCSNHESSVAFGFATWTRDW